METILICPENARNICPAYALYMILKNKEGKNVEEFGVLENDVRYACTAQRVCGILTKNDCIATGGNVESSLGELKLKENIPDVFKTAV